MSQAPVATRAPHGETAIACTASECPPTCSRTFTIRFAVQEGTATATPLSRLGLTASLVIACTASECPPTCLRDCLKFDRAYSRTKTRLKETTPPRTLQKDSFSLSLYIYVYMYICIYTYIHIYIYIFVSLWIYHCFSLYIYLCMVPAGRVERSKEERRR